MKRALLTGTAIAAIILLAVGASMTWQHVRELEIATANAQKEAAIAREQARQYAREREQTLQLATNAVKRVEETDRKANESDQQAKQAAEQTLKAREDLRRSQMALSEIQQRREQEMNRMYEALGRISETRRTPSGIVIELADDSFKFDFNKADLRPENREVLSRIAGVLLMSNGYRLSVQGHTDDIGSEDYNQKLSERRASSVAEYLKSSGVSSDIIDVKGFGKSSPRAPRERPRPPATGIAGWKSR